MEKIPSFFTDKTSLWETKRGRLYSFILGVIYLAVGIAFLLADIRQDVWLGVTSYFWESTEGTIQNSRVMKTQASPGESPYSHDFQYVFQVSEKKYCGYRCPDSEFRDVPADREKDRENIQIIVDKYPVGASLTVYYHPKNPEYNTLTPGLRLSPFLRMLGSIFVILIGLFWIRFPFTRKHQPEAEAPKITD